MSEESPYQRPKSKDLRPLVTLIPFILPYKHVVMAALLALLLAAGAMLATPVAMRYLIDNGFIAQDLSTINRYFGWFLLATMAFSVFAALRYYLVTWVGERVVADVRNAVYARVIHMDPAFFEITKTGEVLSRLTTDTTLVQSISAVALSIALRSTINLIGGLVMMVVTSPLLAMYALGGIPLVVIPVALIGRRIRKLSRASQDRVADTSSLAGETLNAMQTVQAFTLEGLQINRYGEAVAHSFKTAIRRVRVNAFLTGGAFMLVFGSMTAILWGGSHQVVAGEMSAGELGQFLMYSFFVGGSATSLAALWGEIQRGAGAMERLTELLNSEPNIQAPEQPETLPEKSEGQVEFDQVIFHYPSRPETRALDKFSLSVSPGENVAIVGPSGAGKSTSFQLLMRFYDTESGAIRIDGMDITRLDPRELRRRIALVPQETVLFGASAMENIRYGRPDATDEEIYEAARLAAADDFIRALPEGYDSFLGERGVRLSGGQRQRVAIARAILKDPPILLLDEATSSLDAESERLVQEALEGLMKNRTTLVIAHRLATVKQADRIVVVNHGRIEAIGNHRELMESSTLYARLAALQFGD